MQYVILSLGQLVKPKLKLSLNSFAELLKEQGRWFPYTRTCLSYLLDLKVHHTLEKFNEGKLDKHAFYEKICQQLGIKNHDQDAVKKSVWDGWERMCELDDDSLNLLKRLTALFNSITNISNELPRLIIISNTNFIHHDYIINKFKKEKIHSALGNDAVWKLSYEAGVTSHKELAKQVLKDIEFRKGDVLISCHRRVDGSVVPEGSAVKFIQCDFTVNGLNRAINDSYVGIKR